MSNSPSVLTGGLHAHLAAWRRFQRLTQEQLAEKIGSKVSTISGWETGARDMDLVDLKRIADAYGVHPALLLFAPPGSKRFEALREVNKLWESMPADVFADWMKAGTRMVPHAPGSSEKTANEGDSQE